MHTSRRELGLSTCEDSTSGILTVIEDEKNLTGNSILVSHSNCMEHALEKSGIDASGEENYGLAVFLDRRNAMQVIGQMWPEDW